MAYIQKAEPKIFVSGSAFFSLIACIANARILLLSSEKECFILNFLYIIFCNTPRCIDFILKIDIIILSIK